MSLGFVSPLSMYTTFAANYGVPIPDVRDKKGYALFLIVQKFLNIFCERIKYEDLPEETENVTANNNILETMIFFAPSLAWFKDETLGLQVLPTTGEYDFTITGMPTSWKVRGANGYERTLNKDNSVLMFNDNSFSIPFLHVMYEAELMADCDMTHRQELKAHRRPLIMEIEEDEKKSANKFVSELTDFKDVIKIRLREQNAKNPRQQPFNTQVFAPAAAEFNGKVFMDDYKEFENRVLTYFGINNVNIEKRERLLTGEISSNDMIIQLNFTSALNSRKEAIGKVNKMFGTNIKVEPNKLYALRAQNLNTQAQQFSRGGDAGGMGNENVQSEEVS